MVQCARPVWYGMARHDTGWHAQIWHGTGWHGAALWHGTDFQGTARGNMAQHEKEGHGTARHVTILIYLLIYLSFTFRAVRILGSRVWPKRKNRGPREARPRDSSVYMYILCIYAACSSSGLELFRIVIRSGPQVQSPRLIVLGKEPRVGL